MKIDPKMIPPEVVEAAVTTWLETASDCKTLDESICAAIAAGLAAWPEMQMRPSGSLYAMTVHAHLVLPLPSAGAPTQGDACNG